MTDVYGTAIGTSYIELYQSDGSGGWSYLTYAYGDTSGDYTFTGLTAGDYRVGFFDYMGEFTAEYYDNAATLDVATDIPVAGSADVTGIDAQLSRYGHIAGTVRDAGGAGIAGIYVEVYRYRPDWDSYEWVTYVQTGSDGTYDIAGLAAGPYRLQLQRLRQRHLRERVLRQRCRTDARHRRVGGARPDDRRDRRRP